MLDLCLLVGSIVITLITFGIPVIFILSLLFDLHILIRIGIGLMTFVELLFVSVSLYKGFKNDINERK